MEVLISLLEWFQANPALSVPLFILAFGLIMAVGIPGGNVLLLSGGFLFGWWLGALFSTVGAVLAAAATFGLIRTAFGRWLDERARHSRFSVRQFIERGNAPLLILPRLVPLFPFFALNVGFTAAGVPFRTYLWTTAVGMLPVAALFCSIGAELGGLREISRSSVRQLLLSPGFYLPLLFLMALTLLGWFVLRRFGAVKRPAQESDAPDRADP